MNAALTRVRKFTLAAIYKELRAKLRKKPAEYLYPAKGIGQLADALQTRFEANGGRLVFISRIDAVRIVRAGVISAVDVTTRDGHPVSSPSDIVISTIPLDMLHRLVVLPSENGDRPPFDLHWRSLRLLYLITRDKVPSEHETLYFPEPEIMFGRVSDLVSPSRLLNQEPGRSAFAIEIPCSYGDETWNCPDEQLGQRCIHALQQLGILRTPATDTGESFSRKLRTVYPVYDLGWRERFDKIYLLLNSVQNLYLLGRTALFLHCNIDHCMTMAFELSKYPDERLHRQGPVE